MPECFDLVIYGGMGDLSRRKLLPALYNGLQAGLVSSDSRIFLTTRSKPDEPVISWLEDVFQEAPPACGICDEGIKAFAGLIRICGLELAAETIEQKAAWQVLADSIKEKGDRPLVHFFAIPPSLFASTCALLGEYGLNDDMARVVLEKPVGHSRESADRINDLVASVFKENQTFRIDHYLGKEAVQNLLALRFSNIMFEELWHKGTVDHIQITIAEDLGVKGREGFYEGTGAMRDMVQNHLLQLLCLVAMEPPARLDADSIRGEKLKVLHALEPLIGDLIDSRVVRGQYGPGAMKGEAVPGYQDDLELKETSETETFVALKTHIKNWRWAGVPFYLRTGKRLPERFAEIVIQFKNIPHSPDTDWSGSINPNRFIIRLQPEDHLALRMMVKDHGGSGESLREVELNLDMAHGENVPRLGPYLRLILDAVRGDQRLFVHRDEVNIAWDWVDKVIDYWQARPDTLKPYASGTWGPYEAHDLIMKDGRKWFEDSKLVGKKNGGSPAGLKAKCEDISK